MSRVLCPVSRVTCHVPCPGILSQRISRGLDAVLPPGHNFTTYVAASYVKWVEGAGARAAPIVVNNYDEVADLEYYDQVGLGRMASDYIGLRQLCQLFTGFHFTNTYLLAIIYANINV